MLCSAKTSTVSAGKSDDLKGRCLAGRYLLHERIGEGAHGRVYRGEKLGSRREMAIKVIGPLAENDIAQSEQCYAEAIATCRIIHPGVVRTFDYGRTDDGYFFLVMEHLAGATLTRILADRGALGLGRALGLFLELLDALEAVHAAGVIHGDLKADNLIIDQHAAGDTLTLIDFSIARLVHGASGSGLWPDDGRVAGTPETMAPEVISGRMPTTRSDIYAAGVVLHQLMTGVLPFAGANRVETMMRHLEDEVVPPSARFPELSLPVELDRVILRALAKRPADRYVDVSDFRSAVTALLEAVECDQRRAA